MSQPILVASWNGGPATARAAERHLAGVPLLDAIVEGITLIEDDPDEMSVGYGGLPNEEGEVELDAAVMDGPLHKGGAVAGLRRVRHAARLALEVLRRTDHALLVGEGAARFARQLGFHEENLLTPKARDAWLAWKADLSPRDAWLSPNEQTTGFGGALWAGHHANPTPGGPPPASHAPRPGESGGAPRAPFTFGTVHASGLDVRGDLFSCTSTSGLSYKIPGRVGDSPILGSGLYTDNTVGSAGCTGRGEASMQSCAAFQTVALMEAGRTPTEAATETLRRIAARTREARLLRTGGAPAFNVTVYAVRKDGQTGAASMHEGYQYVVQRGREQRVERCAFVYSA
ncbi:MAG: N(4)-(beta-N-acetylglucosaminyl)-L-asparaginase [Phycisphaerales bacterium]|nr:N(4)-(beta-N-acetylglucosaminyl)-L-asparaginase [Phycisphaerales bacterium]